MHEYVIIQVLHRRTYRERKWLLLELLLQRLHMVCIHMCVAHHKHQLCGPQSGHLHIIWSP